MPLLCLGCHPSQRFLSLFPHRYDYIWAKHSEPGQSPGWQTESRHPLSDRLIQQGHYLYGVRFGQQTHYLMVDIDATSPYHPSRDPLAIAKLMIALEPLGLVSYVAVTSSDSGGLHLYFPFEIAQNSYKIAAAATALIENAGFTLAQGKLEVFPDAKVYVSDGPPSLFNGHRLPLQTPGSYLLDADWQPVSPHTHVFVQQWQIAQQKNDVTERQVEQACKLKRRPVKRLSVSADKFRCDLDAEIEAGWTGDGQTNHLLGRIALREYVFHHVLHNTEPLTGKLLAQQIESIATRLPGYGEFCDHRHEIGKRSEEWARSVEASKYYPYRSGGKKRKPQKSLKTREQQNQERREGALQRIQLGVAELHQRGELPLGATARREALAKNYRVSQGTLDKNKSLWHPKHLDQASISLGGNIGNIQVSEKLISEGFEEIDRASVPKKLGCLGESEWPQAISDSLLLNETGGSGGFSTGWAGVEERERQRRESGQISYSFDLEKEQEREEIQKLTSLEIEAERVEVGEVESPIVVQEVQRSERAIGFQPELRTCPRLKLRSFRKTIGAETRVSSAGSSSGSEVRTETNGAKVSLGEESRFESVAEACASESPEETRQRVIAEIRAKLKTRQWGKPAPEPEPPLMEKIPDEELEERRRGLAWVRAQIQGSRQRSVSSVGSPIGVEEGSPPNLEEWLKSGDPILEREARSRLG